MVRLESIFQITERVKRLHKAALNVSSLIYPSSVIKILFFFQRILHRFWSTQTILFFLYCHFTLRKMKSRGSMVFMKIHLCVCFQISRNLRSKSLSRSTPLPTSSYSFLGFLSCQSFSFNNIQKYFDSRSMLRPLLHVLILKALFHP